MNTHSVSLNGQELRNGRFFGPFKQSAYDLALAHLEFWRRRKIFSERRIARMGEVELTSELMVMQIAGMQDKKKSLDDYYERFDEQFAERDRVERRFRATIDGIDSAVGDVLSGSEFRRPPLFYSLFGAVYHALYGLPDVSDGSRRARNRLTDEEMGALESAVRKLSELVQRAKDDEEVPRRYEAFVAACLAQTDNIKPRTIRLETLLREAAI